MRPRNGGFTLLEVMVALAVVALAMGAVIRASGIYAGNAAYLKQRTFAQWIAQNKAIEYRLQGKFPRPGRASGRTEFADHTWQWEVTVSATDDPRLRRLDIRVMLADDGMANGPLASLVAFIGKPAS